MNEPVKPWVPSLGSRLAVLRSNLEKSHAESSEVAIPDTPVECHVGIDVWGAMWIRITCEPESVSVDDRSAAVRFLLKPNGYRVAVNSTTSESVSIRFLEEVVQFVNDGHAPGDAGRAALQNWRELLARPAGRQLSDNTLVGLFGELEVLEKILRNGGKLDHWTGWSKDQCDFRLPRLALEVKSTMSANFRRVQIHGLGQLADPEDGSDLILVLRRLEPSPDGRSVPDLTDELVRLGASRAVLLDRLSQVQYSEQHRATYDERRFVSEELALRRIDDSHPRLIPSMLDGIDLSSIDKIDYELNLNGDAEADLDVDLDRLISDHLGGAS